MKEIWDLVFKIKKNQILIKKKTKYYNITINESNDDSYIEEKRSYCSWSNLKLCR